MRLKLIVLMIMGSMVVAITPFSVGQNTAKAAYWSRNILTNGGFETAPHGKGWDQYSGGPAICVLTTA